MREHAVVGQKQQALRVLIEPPDGEKAYFPVLRREQVEHRFFAPVLGRRQHASGLVEHHIGVLAVKKLFSVYADASRERVAFVLRARGDASVDEHAPFAHKRLDLAARVAPRGGDDLVESLLGHGEFRLSLCWRYLIILLPPGE